MHEQRLLAVGVECYAGHRGEQTPRTLMLGDRRIAVAEVVDAWLAPDHRYFKLRRSHDTAWVSINGLSRDLRVPVTRMSEIVNGRRSITADTALRLARYFAMTPQFWMNLQAAYDLDLATRP